MKSDYSVQGILMRLNEDYQPHDRKPPVIDDQGNRRTNMMIIQSRYIQSGM